MSAKFRQRLWSLRHLRRSGMEEEDLLKVYKSSLRPVLDFACPTYHPLLSVTQTNQLEALQKRASKIIFGFNSSYDKLIQDGKMTRLAERREKLCLDFARKAVNNPRFSETWFPSRKVQDYNLRRPLIYEEFSARTERMFKNPVCYMRKMLNSER